MSLQFRYWTFTPYIEQAIGFEGLCSTIEVLSFMQPFLKFSRSHLSQTLPQPHTKQHLRQKPSLTGSKEVKKLSWLCCSRIRRMCQN